MAKEQKRGNKEARKPKGEKKTPVVETSVSSLMAANAPVGKKKK